MVPKMIKQELDPFFSDQALVICGVFLQPLCHFRVKMGLKNKRNMEVSALMHLVIFFHA
jgi:hypothetical protein